MTQSLERAPGYDYGPMLMPQDDPGSFTMWRYRRLLPVPDSPVHYPLPVGGTPLLPAPALRRAGAVTLYAAAGVVALATFLFGHFYWIPHILARF